MRVCVCAEAGDEEEVDPWATKSGVLDLQKLSERSGFVSPAAIMHFAARFGSLQGHEHGTEFQATDRQTQLLQTTLAVCATRCNVNRVTPEMGRALLKALKPTPPMDVRAPPVLTVQVTWIVARERERFGRTCAPGMQRRTRSWRAGGVVVQADRV